MLRNVKDNYEINPRKKKQWLIDINNIDNEDEFEVQYLKFSEFENMQENFHKTYDEVTTLNISSEFENEIGKKFKRGKCDRIVKTS